MSTQPIQQSDFEIIEALDFEHSPPCETKEGCDQPAAILWRYTCCGESLVLCDSHDREAYKQNMIDLADLWVSHDECDSHSRPLKNLLDRVGPISG